MKINTISQIRFDVKDLYYYTSQVHNITTYINETNTIIQETHLEINNIQEIFNSKIQFINWLKNNGNYGKILFRALER